MNQTFKWIPVERELPDTDRQVFTMVEQEGECWPAVMSYFRSESEAECSFWTDELKGEKVIAWADIPEYDRAAGDIAAEPQDDPMKESEVMQISERFLKLLEEADEIEYEHIRTGHYNAITLDAFFEHLKDAGVFGDEYAAWINCITSRGKKFGCYDEGEVETVIKKVLLLGTDDGVPSKALRKAAEKSNRTITLSDLYRACLIMDSDYINILTTSGNEQIWKTGRWFNDNILQHINDPIAQIEINTQERGEPAVFTVTTKAAAEAMHINRIAGYAN